MELIIKPGGNIVGIHSEAMDVRTLGTRKIRRASQVDPNAQGEWTADLALVGGPCLGPFPTQSEALRAEQKWLSAHLDDLQIGEVHHV